MENKKFNPTIKAIVSIRHLALAVSNKWSRMKTVGEKAEQSLESVASLILQFGNKNTIEKWKTEKKIYQHNLVNLREILSNATDKIKNKKAIGLVDNWNSYIKFSENIFESLNKLQKLGENTVPENKAETWSKLWVEIYISNRELNNEAQAISIQLKLIENYKPNEVNDLTDIILKHIPLKYSHEEAEKYNQEYLEAYEAIKSEASKKKNLWDKLLDILAGGQQQTPAQRVMMQRWVDGEKGDNSL